jgi:hypothetical protein
VKEQDAKIEQLRDMNEMLRQSAAWGFEGRTEELRQRARQASEIECKMQDGDHGGGG